MQNKSIDQMLEELAEMRAEVDAMRLRMQDMINTIITPQQRADIESIKEEFEPLIEAAHTRITQQEAEIRASVCEHGKTVKGARMQAVYVKPRVSWDTDALDAITKVEEHAWIASLRKEGKPSVSIRNV